MGTGYELFVMGKVVYPHIPIRILEGGGGHFDKPRHCATTERDRWRCTLSTQTT